MAREARMLGGSLTRLLGGALAWAPIVPTMCALHAPNVPITGRPVNRIFGRGADFH